MKRTCVARSLALTTVLSTASLAQAQAVVIRVDPASPSPIQGDEWTTAYHTVQEALADSRLGNLEGQHQIWVHGGTYSADALDPGNQNVSIELMDDTTVYGGFDGTEAQLPERDIDANTTVFSGIMPSSTDRSLHVVRAENVGTHAERRFGLHGITVSGGRAIRVDDPDPRENGRGGGLWVNSSAWRLGIAACIFEDNAAGIGGGMFVDTRTSFGSPPLEGAGGPAVNRLIVSSIFRNNEAGGGKAPFTVTVDRGGGGLAVLGSSEFLSVLNCLFHDNVVRGDDSPAPAFHAGGGAILLLKGEPVLHHLTVMNNSAKLGAVAGGIYAGYSNTPPGPGVAKVALQNSIVYGNDRDTVLDFAAQIDADDPADEITLISHSCVQAIDTVVWTDANIADDPLLATPSNPAGDRYELTACSPCVDTADGSTTLAAGFGDFLDVDDDGVREAEPTPDVQRSARVLPDAAACPALPDMGANEFAPAACPADLDCSQHVGFDDVLAVLAAFGSADGPEDLDDNGEVEFNDILIVLSQWGTCPGRGGCSDSLDDLGDIAECLNRFASEPEKLAACIEAVAILQSP